MTNFKLLAIGGSLLFSANLIGQTLKTTTPGKAGMFPADVEFVPGSAPVTAKGFVKIPSTKGTLTAVDGLVAKQQETDATGMTHIRYQQSYLGIPVENAYEIVHSKGGSIIRQNGKLVETFDRQLTATPNLSEASALQQALSSIHAQTYKWQLPGEEAFIKKEQDNPSATFYPKGSLVFYSGEEDVVPSAMRLAYKFDVYAQQPLSRQYVFVDATNGAILGKRDLIHETNATGSAVTGYSGTQTITTDSYNGSYRLRETGRGNGIQTYNLNKSTTYSNTDFTDADNTWNNVNANKDQYATDAHWGAEKTYDYYKTKYNRNSIDNAGFAILSYVHYSTNYFNAFWDGSRMTYGDGDASDGNKPLTALDVCGHEITHGLTEKTSGLNYSGESGAMNEGFSDIFGTAIEFYARPSNADWLIGKDFYTIRSMSNPNAYSQPDTYQGTYWVSTTSSSDNGGVHTNSGVLNYWFYLLSVGGSGTNDKGTAYNVTGLGIDKAAAIAFRTNTVYLTSTATYATARTYAIQSAVDLYGSGSAEATQAANAWTAVGVGGTTTPTCTDNYEANESISAAKTISVNTAITAKISSSTDKDYFKFTTTSSAPKVKISLTNLPADYDVKLYNSAGTQIGISQNGSTTAESITYNATAAATYYVYVYGYNGTNSTSCYSLTASVSGTNFFDGSDGNNGLMVMSTKEVPITLSLQPVPASSYTTLVFGSKTISSAFILVTDMAGAPLKKLTIPVSSGTNQYRLSVSDLKNGTYFIKMITQTGEMQVKKLIVQH